MVVRDPAGSEQRAELLRAEEVALHLVLQVPLPVEADRAGNVRLGVERRVLVDLDDANRVVVQMILDPLCVDQYVLRVVGHASHLRGENSGNSVRIPILALPGSRLVLTLPVHARACRDPWNAQRGRKTAPIECSSRLFSSGDGGNAAAVCPRSPAPSRGAGGCDRARRGAAPRAGSAGALRAGAGGPRRPLPVDAARELAVEQSTLAEALATGRKALRRTLEPLPAGGWCERAERLISDRLDGGLDGARRPPPRRPSARLRALRDARAAAGPGA